jgi:cytochrome c553
MPTRCCATIWAFALSVFCGHSFADDARLANYGRHLAQECTSCHRPDGMNVGIPPIIGVDVDSFVATMKSYQSGARPNPAMVSVAKSLDDEQLRALALYYASLLKPSSAARDAPTKN